MEHAHTPDAVHDVGGSLTLHWPTVTQPDLGFPDCLDDYSRGQVDTCVAVIEWLVDRFPAGDDPAVALLVDELGGQVQRYSELADQHRVAPAASVPGGV